MINDLIFLKTDTFAVMILQIPVEGGHQGAELTVRHELGSLKIDRKKDNDRKLHLSTSYSQCSHEISAVTEGWSLAMTFLLKWNNPILPLTFCPELNGHAKLFFVHMLPPPPHFPMLSSKFSINPLFKISPFSFNRV